MTLLRTALSVALVGYLGVAQANIERAQSLLSEGKIPQATAEFSKHTDNVQALIALAKIHIQTDLDEAEEWIEKAVKLDANNAEAHFQRGVIMGSQASTSIFSALGYAKKSLKSFTRATELAPKEVKYLVGLLQFHVSAPGIAGGDLDVAKRLADQITEIDAKEGLRAQMELAQANEDEAKFTALYHQSQEQYPDSPEFSFMAGLALQSQEDYERAFTVFAQAVDAKDNDEESQTTKWSALYQIGRTAVISESHFEEGIAALKRYLAETPSYHKDLPSREWAQFRLGNLLALNQKPNEAKAIYQDLKGVSDKRLAKKVKKALKKL